MLKLGIVGNGFVGRATNQFKNKDTETIIYDINPKLCCPENISLSDLASCDLIMICVPTPSNSDGSCNTFIVESVINSLRQVNDNIDIIVRSTVEPGFCSKHNVEFLPEFLTEKNSKQDFLNCKKWILGCEDDNVKNKVSQLINSACKNGAIKYNNIQFVTRLEAEMIKYTRNCYLATKVSFFNEIEHLCRDIGINYNNVKNCVTIDDRIGSSHTNVPGHDGERGYGGTCFPKDTMALLSFMEKKDFNSYVLKSIVDRNKKVDRPNVYNNV